MEMDENSKNFWSETFSRLYGGDWFTVDNEREIAAGRILLSSSNDFKNICVRISRQNIVRIFIAGRELSPSHSIFSELRGLKCSWSCIERLLTLIDRGYYVCSGITDDTALDIYFSDHKPPSVLLVENHGQLYEENGTKKWMMSTQCPIMIKNARRGIFRPQCTNCGHAQSQLLKCSDQETSAATSSSKYGGYSSVKLKETLLKKNDQIKSTTRRLHSLEAQLEKLHSSSQRPASIRCKEIIRRDMNAEKPSLSKPASLFLHQQMKAHSVAGPNGMRWDRAFITWAMQLRFKSAAAYDYLRESGAVKLPCADTLLHYFNELPVCEGIKDEIILSMIHDYFETHKQPDAKYLAMSLDEMKVKANLVYEKKTNQLIGYIGSTDTIQALDSASGVTNDDGHRIATDVLVVYIRGISTGFERAIAWIPVRCLSAYEIQDVVWTVKTKIELFSFKNGQPRLKVVTVTCDGLAANHLFFKLHGLNSNTEVQYRARDPLDPDNFLFFIVDPPHVMKTMRNNLEKSGDHEEATKYLLYEQPMLWRHVTEVYKEDAQNVWRMLPKLTHRHVYLAPSDKMKVKLATQVLSSTVSKALAKRPGMESTAKFCGIANRMFDMLNGKYHDQDLHTLNPDLAPYKFANDDRLKWLEDECLGYFTDWENWLKMEGFTNEEQKYRLMSYQTRNAIEIMIKGFVGAVRWILSQPDAPPYILSNVFNQDRLEIYFGHVRAAGGSSDHPDWYRLRRIATSLHAVDVAKLASVRGSNVSYAKRRKLE